MFMSPWRRSCSLPSEWALCGPLSCLRWWCGRTRSSAGSAPAPCPCGCGSSWERTSRGWPGHCHNIFWFLQIFFTTFYLVCVCQLLGFGDLEEDVVCAQGPPVLLVCQGVGLLETVCSKISIYFYWNFIALWHAHDDGALLSCKLLASALSDFVELIIIMILTGCFKCAKY